MPEFYTSYNDKLLQTVKKTIAAYDMLAPYDAVLIGVSGGPDSVALVHLLCTLTARFSLRLGVAHFNHGLRGTEADNDADFVASLAKKIGLPCYVHKENVTKYQQENRLSLEEAARRRRYTFFNHVAKRHEFNKIALGHHRDDNAELVLMNLLRGSGPLGLSGIPPVRDNSIIRPLIHSRKSEIMDFLKANRFQYVADKSNLDARYLRNRIRHDLIPHLKASYNPNIIETLNRLAIVASSEEAWLESEIDKLFSTVAVSCQAGRTVLSVSRLSESHLALQRRLIRKAIYLAKGDLRRISFAHVDSIIGLLTGTSGTGRLDLPDRISVRKLDDALVFTKEKDALRHLETADRRFEKITFNYSIEQPGRVFIKETEMVMTFSEIRFEQVPDFNIAGQHTAFVDNNRLRFPLTVRNFRSSDRFRPLGMKGTKMVKKYFTDEKVPPADRHRCPVVVSQGKIIWLGGHRIDESVKITPVTRTVMKIELFLA